MTWQPKNNLLVATTILVWRNMPREAQLSALHRLVLDQKQHSLLSTFNTPLGFDTGKLVPLCTIGHAGYDPAFLIRWLCKAPVSEG